MSVVKIVNEGGEYLFDVEKGTAAKVELVPVSAEVVEKLKKQIEVAVKMDAATSLRKEEPSLEARLIQLENEFDALDGLVEDLEERLGNLETGAVLR